VRLVLQQASGLVDNHCNGHFVLHSPRDNDICDMPLWLDILQEGGFHVGKPLLNNAFDRSTSLADIADDLLASALAKKYEYKKVDIVYFCETGRGRHLLQQRSSYQASRGFADRAEPGCLLV
jgi:hypothetical protein